MSSDSDKATATIIESPISNEELEALNSIRKNLNEMVNADHVPLPSARHLSPSSPTANIHWRLLYHQILNLAGLEEGHRMRSIANYDPEIHNAKYSIVKDRRPYEGVVSWDKDTWSDRVLIRFLRARKHDISKATTMFVQFLNWRDVFGVHDILFTPPDIRPFEDIQRSVFPDRIHKFDKHGRPVYIQKTSLINVDDFNAKFSVEALLIAHTWFMENCLRLCEENSRITGKRVDKIVNIIDAKGVGLSNRKNFHFFRATSKISQDYYPEFLGVMYFINVPRIFTALFAFAKRFLDPVTVNKIRILDSNLTTLVEELGPECLPVEYGGTCNTCPSGICIPPLIPLPKETTWKPIGSMPQIGPLSSSQSHTPPHEHEPGESHEEVKDAATHEQSLSVKPGKIGTFDVYVPATAHDHSNSNSKNTEDSASTNDKVEPSNEKFSLWCKWHSSKDITFKVEHIPQNPVHLDSQHNNHHNKVPVNKILEEHKVGLKPTEKNIPLPNVMEGDIIRLVWDNTVSHFSTKTVHFYVSIKPIPREDNPNSSSTTPNSKTS